MLEASKLCSYSQEYLSLLARRGKIVAKKIGRNWFVAKSALDEYLQKQSIVISLPKSFFANQNISTDLKSEKFGKPAENRAHKLCTATSAGKPILISALTPEEPEVLENGDQPHSKLYEEFLKLNKQKQEQNLAVQPVPVVQPVQPKTPKIELPNRPQPEAVLPNRPPLGRLPNQGLSDQETNAHGPSKADAIIEAISDLKVETEMQDQREEKIVQTLDKLSDSISLFAQKVSEKTTPASQPVVIASSAQLPPEVEEFINVESRSLGYRLRHARRHLSNIPKNPSRMTAIIVSAITLLFILVGGFSFGNADQVAQLIRKAFKDADTLQGYFPGTHANEVLVLDKTGKISIFGHIETQGQLRSMVPDGVAPIVVDSMTKIESLNADYFDDLDSKDFTLAFVTKNGNVTYEDVKLEGNVEIGKTLTLKGPLKLLDELNVYGRLGVFADAYFSKEVKLTGGNLNVQKGDILLGQGNLKISQGTIEITNPTMVKNLNAELLQGQTPSDITQGITLNRVVSNGNSTNRIAFFNGGLYGGQGAFATIGVAGNASFGSSQTQSTTRFTVLANNFSVDSLGNITSQGTTTATNLQVTNGVLSNLIPSGSYNLGSIISPWENLYVNNLVGGGNISGTTSASFVINTDNATVDSEDAYLSFERGATTPNAMLKWNATANRFEFNEPVFISSSSATVFSVSGGPASISNTLYVQNSGNVGIGTTVPTAKLQVVGNASISTNFEASGYASVSSLFGATLATCTSTQNLQWLNGLFTCVGTQTGAGSSMIEVSELGDTFNSNQISSLSFAGSHFSISGTNPEAQIRLDWGQGGPASLSENETVSGVWNFSNGASVAKGLELTSGYASLSNTLWVSPPGFAGNVGIGTTSPTSVLHVVGDTSTLFNVASGSTSKFKVFETGNASLSANFEVSGYASVSSLFGATLATCTSTQNLQWLNGRFTCVGTQTSTGSSFIEVSELGDTFNSNQISSISFSGAHFSLSGTNPEAQIRLDWGLGGPASLSQNEIATGIWNFSNGASIATSLELTSGYASLSNTLWVSPPGYAGNVGVGTRTPTALFNAFKSTDVTLSGNATYVANFTQGTGGLLAIGGDANYSYIQSFNSKPLIINNQGNNTLFNINSGNVGIGTTFPDSKLDVAGNILASASGNVSLTLRSTSATGTDGQFTILTASTSDRLDIRRGTGTLTETLMSIASTGYVGIGTTSPGARLDVVSDVIFREGLQVAGTATASYSRLGISNTTHQNYISTSDDLLISGDLEVNSSVAFDSHVVLGDVTDGSDIVIVNAQVKSHIIPFDNIRDLGSGTNRWHTAFVDKLDATEISGASVSFGGTTNETFTINSDNVTLDAENSQFIFERGSPTTNGQLQWDATSKRFNINFPVFLQTADASEPTNNFTKLTLKGTADQSSNDYFTILNVSNATKFRIGEGGASLSVPFELANTASIGNALFVQSTGNVGIGDTSPEQKLTVTGNILASSSATTNVALILNSIGTGTNEGKFTITASGAAGVDRLDFRNGAGTNLMTIASSGNVGVGTSAPGVKLEVQGTLRVANGTTSAVLNLGDSLGSTFVGLFRGAANTIGGGNWLNLGGYDGMSFAVSNAALGSQTRAMTILTSGNVGIGSTIPTAKLAVAGTASISGQALFFSSASVSQNFEVVGYASVSSLFGATLATCPSTQNLRWLNGLFTCVTTQTGTGSSFIEVSELGDTFTSNQISSISFSGAHFSLSGTNPEAQIRLDWGLGGPASRSISNTWTALNVFSTNASISPKLEVYNATGTASFELFSNNDAQKRFTIQSVLNGFGGGANDRLAIRNNAGTELVSIASNGNVFLGLGATPTGNLILPPAGYIGGRQDTILTGASNSFVEGSIRFAQGSDPNMNIDGGDNNNMNFRTDGSMTFRSGGDFSFSPDGGTGGNVGIGSTTPEQKLEIAGNIIASASAASVGLTLNNLSEDDAKFTIQSTGTTGSIARLDFLGSASQTFMSIASSGNVGIGTTVPYAKLVIRGGGLASENLIMASSSATILTPNVGFQGYTNFSGGLGTGGGDSSTMTSMARLTNAGNLINIGAIQAGETLLTKSGTFATKTDYNAGLNPRGIAVADLSGDGKVDIVTANTGTTTVSVLLNNGNGTFATKVDYAVGSAPSDVALADLNSDGKVDIVAGNSGSTTVSVLLNNGNGTFATKVDYTAGTNPRGVALADLNGDGKADIAAANSGTTTVSVLLNNGNGTFARKIDYTVGSTPTGVALADLNGDGKADIAAANTNSTTVSVLLNNGNGTFATKVDYGTGTNPNNVALADLNGDGKADIVAGTGGATASVLLNNGNGTFATVVTYTTDTSPIGVALADLNGDGKADIVTGNFTNSTVSVLLNNISTLFYAQASTGNVGIGAIGPEQKLEVAGNILASSSATANIGLILNSIGTGANDGKFSILASGAAGVDTLFVKNGAGTNLMTISSAGNSLFNGQTIQLTTDGGNLTSQFIGTTYGGQGFNNIGRVAGGTQAVPTATTDNTTMWQMVGRAYNGGSFSNAARITLRTAGTASATNNGGVITFDTVASGSTTILERMRISSTGDVGIGTTAPAQALDVKEDAVNYVASFANAGNNVNRLGIWVGAGESDGNNGSSVIIADWLSGNGTVRLGNVTAVAGAIQVAYNTTSDERVKRNIADTVWGIDTLMDIKIRDFTYINSDTGMRFTGVIAQELAEVYPQAVTIPDDPKDLLSVDYSKLTPILTRSVQQIYAKVLQLEEENRGTYPSQSIEPGDLVAFASNNLIVRASASYGDGSVVGVATASTSQSNVSFAGRNRVKVSTENGAIVPGDRLTLSQSQAGYAMKMTHAGQSIGIALESFDGSQGSSGIIGVHVTVAYWAPSASTLTVAPTSGTASGSAAIVSSSGGVDILGMIAQATEVVMQKLRVSGDIIAEGAKKTYYSISNFQFPISNWGEREITIAPDADSATQALFQGNGAQAAAQSKVDLVEDNGAYLATYGVDSTRGEIQLSGTADLVNGEAKIFFDYSFTSIISNKTPLRVLITPTSDTIHGQVYVATKTPYGFVVKELNGISSGKFDWLVIARRKGYEGTDTQITNDQLLISNPVSSSEPLASPTPITSILPTLTPTSSSAIPAPLASPTPTLSPTPDPSLSSIPTPTPSVEVTPEPTPALTESPAVTNPTPVPTPDPNPTP